jgi:hypothetical protein
VVDALELHRGVDRRRRHHVPRHAELLPPPAVGGTAGPPGRRLVHLADGGRRGRAGVEPGGARRAAHGEGDRLRPRRERLDLGGAAPRAGLPLPGGSGHLGRRRRW